MVSTIGLIHYVHGLESDILKNLDLPTARYWRKNCSISLGGWPLGCGNGQLEWKSIGPLIYSRAKQMDIPVEIYAPYGTSPTGLTESFLETVSESIQQDNGSSRNKQLPFNPAWIGLVEILHRIKEQPYHHPVGRTIFQKIAYVATQQGLPTGFYYRKSSYGSFSKELKLAESKLINNNLLQEERLGRMFEVKVDPAFRKAHRRYKSLLDKYSFVIEKTTDLFMRVDTKQAEILSTVLFTSVEIKKSKKGSVSEIDVLNAVMQWKQLRRPKLDQATVALTIRNLGMLNWLDVIPDDKLPVFEDN